MSCSTAAGERRARTRVGWGGQRRDLFSRWERGEDYVRGCYLIVLSLCMLKMHDEYGRAELVHDCDHMEFWRDLFGFLDLVYNCRMDE